MNSYLPKSIIAIAATAGILFSGTYAAGGNLPNWGVGSTTTNQPQVQQPREPFVAEPAVRPRTNTLRRTAPTTVIGTQQTGPAGTKAQWTRWSELAWDATKMAVNSRWILQATIQNVRISAVAAICPFRCVSGPDLGPPIRSFLSANGVPVYVADIFANSIAGAWKNWQDSLTIPGLPWYPAFAAFPGPQAPPTPNVPSPLIVLSTRHTDLQSSEQLAARIFEQFRGAEISPEARDAISSFAKQLSSSFLIWLASAQVQGVMGQGPVPTFAPPYVPVGPVVAGNVIPAPGVIIGTLH